MLLFFFIVSLMCLFPFLLLAAILWLLPDCDDSQVNLADDDESVYIKSKEFLSDE